MNIQKLWTAALVALFLAASVLPDVLGLNG